jgi:hypothetical protein
MEGRCGEDPVSARDVRAEIWMSIAGGATAIGLFTHNWIGGRGRNFDLESEIAAEVARSSRDIRRLTSVLLSEQVAWSDVVSPPSSPVKVGARRSGNRIWIIAVNSSRTETVRAAFGVTGLGEGTARVFGESRMLRVRRSTISDTFAPGAVHIYATAGRPKLMRDHADGTGP